MGEESRKLLLARSAVTLIALAHQPQPLQRNASKVDRLYLYRHAVNRGRVGKDEADRSDIHSNGHRTGPCGCPGSSKMDKTLAIHLHELQLTESALQHLQGGVLGAAGRATNFLHVVDVKIDEFAEGADACDPRGERRLATIDLALRVERPALGVFMADESLADGPALATDLGAPAAGFLLADRCHFWVQNGCSELAKGGEFRRKMA